MSAIQIEQISNQKGLQKIEHLIKGYKFKPYYFLRQLRACDINRLFNWQLSKIVQDKFSFVLATKQKSTYSGFLILEKQNWDSSFFGFNCYKIGHIFAQGDSKEQIKAKNRLIEFVSSLCKEKNIRYLNVQVDTQDVTSAQALECCAYNLISVMLNLIYFTKHRRRHFKIRGKIRPYKETDLPALRKIAKNSMRYDHFHSDRHFSKQVSDSVYAALLENCCKGILADKVFVVERKRKVVGYAALRILHDINNILPLRIGYIRHLAARFPQGFGCGPGLQEEALSWFKDKVDIVESATTIENLPIIRISLKSNMDIACSHLRFVKWFGK